MLNRRLVRFLIAVAALLVVLLLVRLKSPAPLPIAKPLAIFPTQAAKSKIVASATSTPLPSRSLTEAPRFSTMQEYRAELAARPAAPEASAPQPAIKTPENEVRRIQTTLRKYRAAFGQNPVGSNPEIATALLGKNPTGAKFLDRAGIPLNEKGEWIDDWGTPYFFHAISGAIMEIRSAGPDKKLFTPDDIVR